MIYLMKENVEINHNESSVNIPESNVLVRE